MNEKKKNIMKTREELFADADKEARKNKKAALKADNQRQKKDKSAKKADKKTDKKAKASLIEAVNSDKAKKNNVKSPAQHSERKSDKSGQRKAKAAPSAYAPAAKKSTVSEKRAEKGEKKLKVMFFGGVGEIGKNMTALEYDDTIIVVDCGMAFPDNEINPGIDSVIPDYSYLVENARKVKGVMLTHAHEDHLGGLPYFLKDVPVTVYASAMSIAFLENKLKRNGFPEADTKVVDDGEVVEIGPFKVEFVAVTHSVAGSFALSITTPKGVVFMTGDFKIDHTPVDGRHMNLTRIAEIGKKGVLLLMQDSTNVERPGYTMSESAVGKSLDNVFRDNVGRRIIVATFASNVHRVQQIINVALKYSRRVAFSGTSMQYMTEIAKKLKALTLPEDKVVDLDKISGIPDDRLCIIATGTQGEPESALTRMSNDEFKRVVIGPNDTVILSASTIPGNERSIYKVINNLCKRGAKVIYESLYEVHSSGHACREELKMMFDLIKPKFFIPVHGEYRHLKKHAELAEELGIPYENILLPELGFCVEVSHSGLKRRPDVKSGAVMLVGDTEAEESMMTDRRKLAAEGVVIAVVNVQENSVDIMVKGLNITDKFSEELKTAVMIKIAAGDFEDLPVEDADKAVRKTLTKLFYRNLKHCPLIVPVIIGL